jgi:hypothetical protein
MHPELTGWSACKRFVLFSAVWWATLETSHSLLGLKPLSDKVCLGAPGFYIGRTPEQGKLSPNWAAQRQACG